MYFALRERQRQCGTEIGRGTEDGEERGRERAREREREPGVCAA